MEELSDPGRHVLRDRYRAGVRSRGAGAAAGESRTPLPGRRTLRWRAEEDLVYEPANETLHRPGCSQLAEPESAEALARGAALERVTAPRVCGGCRPDVTLMLGPH